MAEDPTAVVAEYRRLFSMAYRMLGSVTDAEDAVQEAFLRWERAEKADVANRSGWLTTVLTRYCLDLMRSARMRRETYVGTWLPEPIVGGDAPDPADQSVLDESVSLAALLLLERLSPAERTVFVLHEVFCFEFREVAAIVGRSPAACRQLASRARQSVRGDRTRFACDRVPRKPWRLAG